MEWSILLLAFLIALVWINSSKTNDNSNVQSTNSFSSKLAEIFSMDLRSLALFRIFLAITLIIELFVASGDIVEFFSDEGPNPRFLMTAYTGIGNFSIHMISGRMEIQLVLFLISMLFALAMLFGYRTRFATFMSWFLYISLQNRNPLIIEIGDYMLKLILFFGMFLPLGAYYSIDSALNSSKKSIPKTIFSICTTAYLIQVASWYVFSAFLKLRDSEWVDGTALFYVLNLITVTTPLAQKVLELPLSYLKILCYSVFKFEFYGPFMLFSPWLTGPIRTLTIFTFFIMFINFGLFLDLENITYIGITAMVPFLPGWFWEKVSFCLPKSDANNTTNTTIYYDDNCNFCKKLVLIIKTFFILPDTKYLPAQSEPSIYSAMQLNNSWVVVGPNNVKYFKFKAIVELVRISPIFHSFAKILDSDLFSNIGNSLYNFVATNRKLGARLTSFLEYRPIKITPSLFSKSLVSFCLLYVFILNISTLDEKYKSFPEKFYWVGNMLRLDQRWGMFTSTTGWFSGWYTASGKLTNGTEVDVIRNKEMVSWKIPELLSADYKNRLWRRYILNVLGEATYNNCLSYFSEYLCKKWNSSHNKDKQLEEITYYFMKYTPTLKDKKPLPVKTIIATKSCIEKKMTIEQIIEDLDAKFTENQPLYLLELYRMASDIWKRGDLATAELLYEKAVALHEKLYGKEHPSFTNAVNILLAVYNSQGKQEKANEIRKKYSTNNE